MTEDTAKQSAPGSLPCSTSFTPGPWTVKHGTNIFGTRRDTGSESCLCTTGGHQSNQVDCTAENHANAKLIAAAPELLAAVLKVLRDECSDQKMADEFGGYVLDEDVRKQCEAAIATALT